MSTIRGFPDYMYPNGAAPAVLTSQTFVASPDIVLGPFDVSSWPITEVWFTCSAIAGPATHVLVNQVWSSDGVLAGVSPQKRCYMQAGSQLMDNTPNYGSSFTIEISALPNPGGSFSGTLNVLCRGGMLGSHPFDHTILEHVSSVVGAGGATLDVATLITPGWATLFYGTGGLVPTYCALDVLQSGNNWRQMVLMQTLVAGEAGGNLVFPVPASQLRLRIGNQSGGAQAMEGRVVVLGY